MEGFVETDWGVQDSTMPMFCFAAFDPKLDSQWVIDFHLQCFYIPLYIYISIYYSFVAVRVDLAAERREYLVERGSCELNWGTISSISLYSRLLLLQG